uniref:Beta-glucosidase 12-like n=1 Tax=Tanacetum cinerariifolium TaxID=118510 RepID=A0A699GGV9_TANCI|nr:beta-glucosidase 12-like [Tanacetum cinerariifolium]
MVGPSNSEDLSSRLDLSNPLHLQNSDFSSDTIISVKLTGTDNYRVWAAAMKKILHIKSVLLMARSSHHLYPQKIKKSCVSQQEPLEITKAPNVTESNMKAPASEGRALPADKEPGMRMNDGAPTTSIEESMDCKSESRLKHGLKRGVQRQLGATFKDGKGPRIWDTFAHQFLGKITNEDNGDVGDGFYHCYKPMPNFTSSTLCVDQLLHYVEDVKM